jgi:hypothetical protein
MPPISSKPEQEDNSMWVDRRNGVKSCEGISVFFNLENLLRIRSVPTFCLLASVNY